MPIGYEVKTDRKAPLVDRIDYSVKDKYGFVPESVLCFNIGEWNKIAKDDSFLKKTEAMGGIAKAGGGGAAATYPYSRFNPALAAFLIQQYTEEDDFIYDPFAGRGTRGVIANYLKRHYFGIDVSPKTVKMVKEYFSEINYSDKLLEIFTSDGTCFDFMSEFDMKPDCVFTCPPYWNKEQYEEVPGQLSAYKTYEEFLERINDSLKIIYKTLKETEEWDIKPFIVVTGALRQNRVILDFSHDLRRLAYSVGFQLHDEIVHRNESMWKYLAVRRNEATKITAKTHEIISIFVRRK